MYVHIVFLTDDRDDVDLPVQTPHALHIYAPEAVTIGWYEVEAGVNPRVRQARVPGHTCLLGKPRFKLIAANDKKKVDTLGV